MTITDINNANALHVACYNHQLEMLRFLLCNGLGRPEYFLERASDNANQPIDDASDRNGGEALISEMNIFLENPKVIIFFFFFFLLVGLKLFFVKKEIYYRSFCFD